MFNENLTILIKKFTTENAESFYHEDKKERRRIRQDNRIFLPGSKPKIPVFRPKT